MPLYNTSYETLLGDVHIKYIAIEKEKTNRQKKHMANNYQRTHVTGDTFVSAQVWNEMQMHKCIGNKKVNLKKLRAHSKLNRKEYLINNNYSESVNCNRIN